MKSLKQKHTDTAPTDILKHPILHPTEKIKTVKSFWHENKKWLIKSLYKKIRKYKIWIRILLAFLFVVFFFFIAGVSYKAGFHQGVEHWFKLNSQIRHLEKSNATQISENFSLEQKLSNLEQQQAIQGIEYQKVLEQVKQLSYENAKLKEDNLLYERIMGKPSHKKGIEVRAFKLAPGEIENSFKYNLTLISNLANKKMIEGTACMMVSGKMKDRDITVPIHHPSCLEQLDAPKFRFKQFQEIKGNINLPMEFQPKYVTIHINPVHNKRLITQEILPWWVDRA